MSASSIDASLVHIELEEPRAECTSSSPAAAAKQLRVLIVDDASVCQRVLSKVLLARGFTTDTANDGLEALNKLTLHDPCLYDVVLMDLRMPVMDGITSITKIREIPCLQGLPIIAMSAEVGDEVKDMSIGVGANAFMEKPVKSDLMISQIKQYFG